MPQIGRNPYPARARVIRVYIGCKTTPFRRSIRRTWEVKYKAQRGRAASGPAPTQGPKTRESEGETPYSMRADEETATAEREHRE